MKQQSYWLDTCKLPTFPKLEKEQKFDIVIIGGGITGILCAYYLRNSNLNIAVVEQAQLASGTTGHTTGKISYLHETTYQFLEQKYSLEHAKLYFESNKEAFEEIEKIIEKENIDCDFKKNTAYIYTKQEANISRIQKEVEVLKKITNQVLDNSLFDPTVLYSVGLPKQAVFHPLKYLSKIISICQSKGISFYENSLASDFAFYKDSSTLRVNNHSIVTKQLVFACRYPPTILPELYFLKISQTKEFAWHEQTQQKLADSYLCIDDPVTSLRPTLDGQIHGGYDHEIGMSYPRPIYQTVTKHTNPWSAQDSKTNRGIPYIGYFSKRHQNVYIASGFNKWGMTLSHVSAKLICDLILKNHNPYQFLYSIHKKNFSASYKEIGKSLCRSYKGFIQNRLILTKYQLEKEQGKVMRIKGRLYAVYKDHEGKLHFLDPYCKHLRCVVAFNSIEKTWDCPCHGSRYDLNGNILEGPTLAPLPPKKST